MSVRDCVFSLAAKGITQQPAGITGSYTYGHVGNNKQKAFMWF